MSYFYDLHCHTIKSSCSSAKLKDIVATAKKRGLDGVAVADHNKLYRGPSSIDGIDIIPATEVSAKGEEHILAYYVKEDIERGQSFKKTIESIKENGGYAVWAHPLRDEEEFNKEGLDSISLFDGLESGNAMNTKKEQQLISKKAREESLLELAGSDAHMTGQVGTAVVRVSKRLSKDNFIEEIRKGEIIVREEIVPYREKNQKMKNFMRLNKRMFKTEKNRFAKNLLLLVFLRNYLRVSNIFIRRINFSYKKREL